MGMALALEHMMEWLREKNGWKPNECGVQIDAMPSFDAGSFYVALDDAGVETGDERTDSLKEILSVTVGIWRRPEHLMKDQRGLLKLPHDKYVLGAFTLAEMERKIIIHKRFGFHNNYDFLNSLNTRYNLPHDTYGAEFRMPLVYRGRSRIETTGFQDQSGNTQAWYGYRLRFRGLWREQKLRSSTDALG